MWETTAPILIAGVAAIGTIANTVWNLWKDRKNTIAAAAVADSVSKATGSGMDILAVRVSALELRCSDLRVEIAEKYVSRSMLETTETRLIAAISAVETAVRSMSDRLDRVFERPNSAVPHR